MKATPQPQVICPGCRQPFTAVRPNQKHCRPVCSAKAQHNPQRSLPVDLEQSLFGPDTEVSQ